LRTQDLVSLAGALLLGDPRLVLGCNGPDTVRQVSNVLVPALRAQCVQSFLQLQQIVSVQTARSLAVVDVLCQCLGVLRADELIIVGCANVDQCLDGALGRRHNGGIDRIETGRGDGVEGRVVDGIAVYLADIEVLLHFFDSVRVDPIGHAPDSLRRGIMVICQLFPVGPFDQGYDTAGGLGCSTVVFTERGVEEGVSVLGSRWRKLKESRERETRVPPARAEEEQGETRAAGEPLLPKIYVWPIRRRWDSESSSSFRGTNSLALSTAVSFPAGVPRSLNPLAAPPSQMFCLGAAFFRNKELEGAMATEETVIDTLPIWRSVWVCLARGSEIYTNWGGTGPQVTGGKLICCGRQGGWRFKRLGW